MLRVNYDHRPDPAAANILLKIEKPVVKVIGFL